MNQFSLEDQTATLINFNPRAELEGKDTRPAADLKLMLKAPNTILSEFGPMLRDSFYHAAEGGSGQGELVDPISDKPNLKNPMLGPISIEWEGVGYTLVIDLGLGGKKSNLELGDVKVNAFNLEMQEGGTVVLTFRCQCHPDERASGKLCTLIKQDVTLSLMPPDVEELQEAA